MKLRDYQQDIHECVVKEWQDVQSTLVVAPTGSGKTIIFADIILQKQPARTLVVAHREELIWQAKGKIERFTGLRCEIEMADLAVHPSLFGTTPVIISTIQTLTSGNGERRRMGKFDPKEFGLLIVDEAHHATAATYRDVINYFSQNPDLKILGVTATPDRADEEALGQIFKSVAKDYEILDAIHDGWLVDVEQQMVTINGLDYSGIRTTAGDLNGADLAAVLEAESNLQGIAAASIKEIGNRRTLVFAATVKQAEVMSNIFNRHKAGMSEWVCGKTNKEKRRESVERYAKGLFQVMVNVGVFTEGVDDAGIECVVMARATKSRSLYSQMIGRSIRPLDGLVDPLPTAPERRAAIAASKKPSCLVVDFVGNSGKHKLMTSADILGGNVSDEAIERAIARAKKLGEPVKMSEALDKAQEDLQKEAEQRRLQEELRKARVVATATYNTKKVSPFDVFDIAPAKPRGWDFNRTLSEKQSALLLKQGIDPAQLPYVQARQLIGEIFKRWDNHQCSFKQGRVLKRYGYDTKMSRTEASKILDALAKNNWKPLAKEPEKETVPF